MNEIAGFLGILQSIPPAFVYILGAALLPLFKGRARKAYLVAIGVLGLALAFTLKPQTSWVLQILPEIKLTLLHADALSLIMGYIFTLIGLFAIIYSLDAVKETGHHICALLYIGSSLGAVFAGDFITLYIFWEIMAVSSLGLIWYEGSKRARDAGMRYILFHLFGGCALLAGIIIHFLTTGSLIAGPIEEMGLAYFLILLGIGVNTAFIPLHTWLPDSYPKATIAGSVFLSVYTTKTGVYALARTFPAAEAGGAVAYMGAVMAIYGVVFALLQNDVRKLLSYHIVSQVGYMVAGVGIGTMMGINGGIAHVFNHILYKALLFMCMGAVIYETGRMNLTELGGLARKMPVTTLTCIVAAFSISGVIGFNGYVSKGMIIHAAEESHLHLIALALMLASVGTFLSFLKLTYFTFFAAPSEEIQAKEAPVTMLIPMVATAALCVAIGVYPQMLYRILPFPEEAFHYNAYSAGHTLGTAELLLMTAFMFFAFGFFKPHERITYDIDRIYRRAGRAFLHFCEGPLMDFAKSVESGVMKISDALISFSRNPTATTRMFVDAAAIAVLRPFNPAYKKYEADLNELRRRYHEPVENIAIGTGVLLVLIFFALLLAIYLAYTA
ncbi:MAG: Na(+)/H(+) antiporter subunit D [Candidatus Methanospirare jalkutatii]|nr:MAG: Na(+)/H(+) antiporter subunit D [Candidatus Methanospirare jalkutatii]UYZ40318.1 MAG: Na(+)/H(+) antiporter subunit D [Candidatus Methanospirare jalkutatii]